MPPSPRKIAPAALAAFLLVSRPAAANGPASVVLTGHVPRQIHGAQKLERLPSDEDVGLTLVVRLDQTLLDRTLAEIYAEKSPAKRRYLSSSEFAAKFDLARKRQALKDFAAAAGLAVDAASDRPESLVVKASGPSSRVERAFGVRLNRYRGADGQVFRANDSDPTVPAALLPHLNAVLG
ncbi:MAG: protease pro-enzyme activation domain-containing protein, partial [Elusimicrobiota bacterium]